MQRFYLILLSVILSLSTTPPSAAAGRVATISNKVTSASYASASRPVYQDFASTKANHLDRRHALVGANCMVNRLNTTVEVASGTAHLENLVDKDLTNGTTFISGVKAQIGVEPSYTIRDMKHVYAKGTTAGFVVTFNNTLQLSALKAPMRIFFYKDGNPVGSVTVDQKEVELLSLKLLSYTSNTFEYTAKAPADFDEIGLGSTELLDAKVAGALTVRYAFVGKNGKYYIDSEETNGISAFKKAVKNNYPGTEFSNDTLILGQCRNDLQKTPKNTGNTIDNNPDDFDPLVIGALVDIPTPITVSAFGGNDTKNLPFKKGMTVGFETSGADILDLISFTKFREYIMNYDGKSYTWDKQNELGGEFTLLGLTLGGGRQDIITTLDKDCNAIELFVGKVLSLGATNVYRMFVVLPPSIDEDPNLTVTADRSLCDEQKGVTLHSTEPVTWECTTTPERAQKPTLKNATDGLSCTVSGFVNAGDYVFTATAADGRKATTTVTYGVRPIINTAIRPWVNNFTEKGVSYSANADQYKKWYKLNSFALIPEIVTDTANLVTPSLDDYAKAGGISLASKKMLSCVFRSQPYQSNEKVTVGFVARTKWTALNLNLLNGLKVKVYDAGKEVKKVTSENTHFKVLSAGLINSDNYATTQYSVEIDANTPFDAISLWSDGLLDVNLSEMDVYYAFVEPSTLEQPYNNDVAKSWQPITHSATGASIDASKLSTFGVAKVADAVENLTNIIDDDNTNYATVAGLATVGAGHTVAVKLGRKFEGGHQVKFIVSNEEWLKVDLGSFINLKAYLNGKEVAKKTNWDVLSLNVIGGENKEAEILWTPTDDSKNPVDFDEISISFNGVAKVADVAWIYGIQVANDADGDGIIDANDDESCDNPYLIDENESELNKAHDYVHGKLNLRRYMKPDLATFSKGQWFSICLPVDLTFNQFVKTFGNNAVLGKPMNFLKNHESTLVFDIDEVYGNNVLLHKDTPYIIKLGDNQNLKDADESLKSELEDNNKNIDPNNIVNSVYIIQGVDYNIAENSKDVTDKLLCSHSTATDIPSVVWQGTYKMGTHLDKGFYTMVSGYLTKYVNRGTDYFRGLRCWMYEVGSTQKAESFDVSIFGKMENLTTGIRTIKEETNAGKGNIYSIDGQLFRENATSTANLPMGVYIWNHKKIVIK